MDLFNDLSNTNNDEEKKKRLQQKIADRKEQQYQNNAQTMQIDPMQTDAYKVEADPKAITDYNRNVIAQSSNPEEESYKLAIAKQYSDAYGIPLQEAMDNVDNYNEALFGKDEKITPDNYPFPTYKNAFKAVKDMIVLGNNNVKIGDLGNKIMRAEREGNTEYAAALMKSYEAYKADNETRMDNIPRNKIIEALEAGAQSLPFTGYTAAAGLFGNLFAPVAGSAAGFMASANLTMGQEYLDLRDKGVSPEIASRVAAISGAIQGAIEVGLGTVSESLAAGSRIAKAGSKTASAMAKGANAIEKTSFDSVTGKLANKLTELVQKQFHFGTAKTLALNWLMRYGFNVAGEGGEEFLQEITSEVGQNIAYGLDKLNVPKNEADEIMKNAMEAFKGGVEGAIVLGVIPSAINAKATVANYQQMQQDATEIESEAMFKEKAADNPVIAEMNDVQKDQFLHNVFEEAQERKTQEENKTAEEIAEVNKIEGNEPAPVDENGDPVDTPAYREEGKIYTTDNVISVDGQQSTNEYIVGDPSKDTENSYGSIQYTMDEDNQTVTITSFDMAPHRENLRNEVYDKFAQDHSNFDIKWETTGARAEEIKNNLIALNPSGKNNGLNYYSSEEQNIEARKEIDSQIKQFMPNITDEQRPLAVSFMETLAKHTPGKDINNFLNTVFQNRQVFGDIQEGEKIANEYGRTLLDNENYKTSNGMTTNVRFIKDLKKVIYAGEHGDFTTYCHELIHAAQPFFDQETETEAERLFNVQDGDWNNSTYTYVDPNGNERVITSAEALTYAAEDYFNTGYVQNEEAKTLMQKIAKIFVDLYDALKRHLTLTPEITAFYDKLFAADNSVLAAAENSLQQEIKEEQKQQQEEAQEEELLKNQREAIELYFKDRSSLGYTREEALKDLEKNEMNKANLYYQNEQIVQEMADKYLPEDTISEEEIETLLNGINMDQFEQTEEDIRENIENFKADEALNQDLKKILADSSLTPEQQQEYFDKITDPNASLTDQEFAVLEAAGIDADNIRYDALMQDEMDEEEVDENPEETAAYFEKLQNEALNYLSQLDDNDHKELYDLLQKRKNTAWAKNAAQDVLVRRDIDRLVAGETIPEDSLLYAPGLKDGNTKTAINHKRDLFIIKNPTAAEKANYKQAIFDQVYASLKSAGSLLGIGKKAQFSFDGSFSNCRSSIWCANNCYAANGKYKMLDKIVLKAIINWLVDVDVNSENPRLAKAVVSQYQDQKQWWKYKVPLRMFAIGEMSENYVKLMQQMNDLGQPLQVFTKRPELAKKLDPKKNRILLSVDPTNYELADKYPEMALAIVYTGTDNEVKWIESQKERFEKYGGVILPALIKNKRVSKNLNNKLPEWARTKYMCDVDGGVKFIANLSEIIDLEEEGKEHNKTNCAWCYIKNLEGSENSGCFFMNTLDDAKLFAETFKTQPKEIVEKSYNSMIELSLKYLRQSGASDEEIRSFIEESNANKLENMAEYDRARTAGSSSENDRSMVEQTQGKDAAAGTSTGADLRRTRVNFQENDEIETVLSQTVNTDKWMKAPNGKDTNLTEKQWLQVRTPSFKNFFGDWENDPENASKVVDENGEPLVVYHGTNAEFDIFDKEYWNSNYGGWGRSGQGFYFTPSEKSATTWSENSVGIAGGSTQLMPVFLNLRNPYSMTDKVNIDFDKDPILKEQTEWNREFNTKYGNRLMEYMVEQNINTANILKDNGYDGVWDVLYDINKAEDIVVFDANQIKSATDNNGNFDINNPSVLMQESDAEYLDAVRLGDLVKAQQMVDQKAAEALAAGATMTIINDDEAIAYKIHRKRDPYGAYKVEKGKHITLEDVEAHNKKFRDAVEWNKNHPDQPVKVPTFFVYKTLGFSETGGAHATYAGTQDEMPWLTWLDAQAIKAYQSPINGNYYIPGDTGMDAKALGLPKEVSQKWLSFRPAFHAGANAFPGQMRVSIQSGVDEYNKGRAKEDRLPIPEVKDKPGNYRWMLHNKLIALVEVPGEINYQQEAETYAKVMAEEAEKWYDAHPEAKRPSKFDRRAQLAYTPDMGYYEYMNQKEPWVLTGQWKMHRVLTEAEIRQVNEASGVYNEGKTALNWIGGYKPEEYGFTADGDKIEVRPTKLADAVTYDEEGNVIPLSQRFNVNNPSPLFQTEDELYRDARNYASWEDFMDAYTMDFDPDAFMDPEYHSQVPAQADAAWYKKVWQFAQQRKEESFNQQEQRETKIKTDDQDALDKQFYSDLVADPTMLDHFLHNVGLVKAQDFNSEAYANPESEEEYNEIQELAALQSYMNTKLANPLWTTNAQRVAKGISITPTSRQQLLTMIRGSERAYREIYSRVMQDDTYAVPEEQSIVKNLEKKAKKFKLISKNDDLETRSPEELRKLADEISNREIADEIRSGQLKLDDRLDKYINSLTTQVTDQQKKMDDLKKTIDDDYQRISDWESRQLLKAYDEMLETKIKYKNNTDLMSEKLRKGLIITSKYQLDNRKLKATYDEVFKKFKDLEKSMQINAETREALNRREEYFFLKEAVARKQREANAAREVKKIRVQLVKRVMRKVPLDRVDYDTARTIIAIQKVFEPNLLGGVNKWIGQDRPYLVTVATAWLTDEEEKQRLTRYLSNGGKAAHQLLAKLETLQKVEDLNEWTAKELQSALRVLPKENWIKDLHLDELADQRDEDINLGITQDFNYKWVYLPNNESEYNTSIRAQIKEWHAVFPKDVEQMIKDAIGDILYNDLINKPMAEWSTEEMTLLAQKVNDLYKMGRDVLAAKKQAQIEAADAIRQQIEKALNDTGITIKDDDSDEIKEAKQKKINEILGNNAALKGTLNDEGESRINRLLHGYADANIRRVTRIMDNYQEGINTNELYWKEDAAYTEEVNQKRARSDKINEALKKYNIGFNELYEKHTIENFYKGESITLTTDELLYFAKAAEDEQSKEAVMYGNMFSAANMQKYKERFLTMDELAAESEYQPNEEGQSYGPGTMMFMDVCGELFTRVLEEAEKLDKKFYQFADAIAADYEEQYIRLNKASIEQFNQPVRRVEKYVPLIRLESNGDTNENKVMQDCLAINGLGKQWVDKGMTQKRITMSPLYQKPVQTGLYKTWLDSVDRTEHFIAYSPLVRELNRVYKSRDAQFTRQFIQNRYGKGMLSYIDEYINELANPTANRVRSASDEFFKTLRGRTAPAYLSWKLSSIIKQGLTSPWPYMQFVDPAHYIAAVFKNIGTKGAIFDLIKEKSPYMRERVMDPMNDLVREMEQQAKNPFSAAYFKASATGMAGLEWIDWVCVAPGWYACYQKEYNRLQNENAKLYQDEKTKLLKANEEADFDNQLSQQQIEAAATAKQLNEAQIEKYAVRYADDVTRQCQPSNRNVDIAPLFKNSSEFAKAYLQFQTSLNVIWQNLRYDIPAAAKNKDFMRITGMVMGYVFAGILMNAVVGGLGDGDDKDKKDEVKDLIWYATTQFTDSVPMIGSELTNMMEKLITGKGSFIGNTDMTPLVSKATRAIQNTAAAIRADPEDKNQAWFKAARSYADAAEMYFGAPVQGIKEVEKLIGVGDGDGKLDISLDNVADVYGIVNNFTKDK